MSHIAIGLLERLILHLSHIGDQVRPWPFLLYFQYCLCTKMNVDTKMHNYKYSHIALL